MLVEIPDHYAATIAESMVQRAVRVINDTEIVPAFLFQLADAWDKGLAYGAPGTFWQRVYDSGAKGATLRRCPEASEHVTFYGGCS